MVRWPGVAARVLTANQVTHSRPRVRISLSPPIFALRVQFSPSPVMDAKSDLVTEPGQNPGEPRPCRFDSCRIRWPRPSWSTGPVRYTGIARFDSAVANHGEIAQLGQSARLMIGRSSVRC